MDVKSQEGDDVGPSLDVVATARKGQDCQNRRDKHGTGDEGVEIVPPARIPDETVE